MNAESSEKSTGATEVPPARPEKPLGSRAPQFVKQYRPLHLSWQVAIFVIGLAIVVGGVVMLPLPGPGWLVIFAGVGVWATEFPWAQRVLRWTKRKLQEWGRWLKAKRRVQPAGAGEGSPEEGREDRSAQRAGGAG